VTGQRPRFEVADVVRLFADEYRRNYKTTASQERILRDIIDCRTQTLGGHIDKIHKCTRCGLEQQAYNSCRNRHCPKCQGTKCAEWLANRLQHILPTEYFHVVFTLPHILNPLALGNKRVIYNILFRTASKTLLTLARDPEHLGAHIGITAVLHSWGQTLSFHPHLHCVVTGGGLSLDGQRWVPTRDGFFLPVRVIGALFRGKFLAALQKSYERGELDFGGSVAELEDPISFGNFRDQLYQKKWVVYAKKPFAGPKQIFRYLGHYTHRVAISNHRIIKIQGDRVSFLYKDYRDQSRKKCMTIKGVEFLRRFLLHELPGKFVRIRHYGILAGPNVHTKLAVVKKLLDVDMDPLPEVEDDLPWWERFLALTGVDVMKCPRCGGHMEECIRKPIRMNTSRAPPLVYQNGHLS
jgi:hypothetical protein